MYSVLFLGSPLDSNNDVIFQTTPKGHKITFCPLDLNRIIKILATYTYDYIFYMRDSLTEYAHALYNYVGRAALIEIRGLNGIPLSSINIPSKAEYYDVNDPHTSQIIDIIDGHL